MFNFIVEQTPNEVKFENMSLEGVTFILDGLSISGPHSGVLHIPLSLIMWESHSEDPGYLKIVSIERHLQGFLFPT